VGLRGRYKQVSEHMKKIMLFILLSFTVLSTQGQEINKFYFLLGSLDDYMGRDYPKYDPRYLNYIMDLSEHRLNEIKRIEEITNRKFKKAHYKNDSFDIYVLKSFRLVCKINSFYHFSKKKGQIDDWGFHFYKGEIKCDKILSAPEIKQLSFLAGLFLTHGSIENGIYIIRLANSPFRFYCAKELLVKMGSEIIMENVGYDRIPRGYKLEFKPSDKVMKAIDIELLKKYTLAKKLP
jgi:hypothetical protein